MTSPTPYESNPYSAAAPAPAPQPQKKKRTWLKVLIAIFAVIVIAVVALFAWGWRTATAMETTAVETCKEDVLAHAKYPGGVTFVDDPADSFTVTDDEQGLRVYTLFGDVDFPNAFGTPNRGTYTCVVKFDSSYELNRHTSRVTGMNN